MRFTVFSTSYGPASLNDGLGILSGVMMSNNCCRCVNNNFNIGDRNSGPISSSQLRKTIVIAIEL